MFRVVFIHDKYYHQYGVLPELRDINCKKSSGY